MEQDKIIEEYIDGFNTVYSGNFIDRQKHKDYVLNLINCIHSKYRNELDNYSNVLSDLLDKTKGVDDDGSTYVAQQIDFIDIENILKKRCIKTI